MITYGEAAARFGISSEAARYPASSATPQTNDYPLGRVQVDIPEDFEPRPRTPVEHPNERLSESRLTDDADTLRDAWKHERERAERAEVRADQANARADAADVDRRLDCPGRSYPRATDRWAEASDRAEARAEKAEAQVADERIRADQVRARWVTCAALRQAEGAWNRPGAVLRSLWRCAWAAWRREH
jgi:hypothetical protein